MEEYLDIYDGAGNCVGTASRGACHGNPALLHRTAHVMVFHPDGRVLLQHRLPDRRIQPDKWDTAAGGHLRSGEDYLTGALRELREELGVETSSSGLTFLFDTAIRNDIESEDVRVFSFTSAGPFDFQREEIAEVRFFTPAELSDHRWNTLFTPNLRKELRLLKYDCR